MRIQKLLASLLLFLGVGTLALAEEQKPSFHASKTSTVTSKVKAVDQSTRMVTLLNDRGEEYTFKADQRVKNLPQLKPGDLVSATVSEELSARVLKKGESIPVASEGTTLTTAPLGAKPAAQASTHTYVVATVAAIDKKNMIVTLKSANGEAVPIKAKEKANVDKLKVGDNVEIEATKSVAIQVTTPKQ
jgi:hypothetical protein